MSYFSRIIIMKIYGINSDTIDLLWKRKYVFGSSTQNLQKRWNMTVRWSTNCMLQTLLTYIVLMYDIIKFYINFNILVNIKIKQNYNYIHKHNKKPIKVNLILSKNTYRWEMLLWPLLQYDLTFTSSIDPDFLGRVPALCMLSLKFRNIF